MIEPIEESYFNWLCTKVLRVENPTPSLTYDRLLRQLHNTEFVFFVTGDDNRAEDGVDLRYHFSIESKLELDEEWARYPCSILEMLVAFVGHAQFQTNIPAREWFWRIIENLELEYCNDASDYDEELVAQILEDMVWRNYDYNGKGGLFPLTVAPRNQAEVEIWDQFAEFLIEHDI